MLSAWLLATALVAGCQSNPAQWNDQVRGTIDTSLQQAQPKDTKTGVPSDVTQELLPPLEITVEGGQATPVEPRFDLSVANASARQVFMGIVEGTPYDIVLQPDVGGTVTLNLKNVTVPEALNALRDAYGYEYRRDGNRFFILGRELQTRIFTVNYLNLTRKGKSDTHVKSGDISGMTSGSSGSGSGGTGTSNIEVETQSQSDFWKELGETLKAIVGGSGDHRVVINAQAGLVVVRAMPDELRLVENYLGATHASIQRQVVLEAKIIEVELNDRFQTGINWARIGTNSSFSQTGGGTATSASGWLGDIAGNSGNLDPSSLFSNTDASAFGGIFSLAVKSGNFAAFVELLKTQGQVQVLSSPRVSTVNNQKAVIKVGGDDFFVTSVTSASSSSTSSSGPSIELTSFFSGIALDVTPQIDENNNIVLHIHPSVSTVTEKNKTVTISGEGFVLPLASSAIQESDNIVRAQSSQIIVIGGLMKEASTEDNASVPLLGDIPVLGNLFKHKKITRVKRELVILLKPTIINTPDQWGNEVKDAQERIKKIKLGS
ncbi:MAG: pilus (MSHA type) biogenesis protein MshL [Gammaproteobacteria bacterium]|nr:pilus (MSHA type) biogenesis protein MshL [Gammaproteobacteria bacterium]